MPANPFTLAEDPPMPEEPDTYDLAFDPEDEPSPSPAKKPPAPKPAASGTSGGSSGGNSGGGGEPDTFELDTPEPEIHDPRMGKPLSKPVLDDPESADDPEEPKTISPAKAMRKREEDRIRAAEALAIADAKKKKLILTLVGGLVGLIVIAYVVLKLF